MTSFTIQPIGTLHTPWQTVSDCPRNGRQPDPAPPCTVRVLPAFVDGLLGLAGLSHLILLYWLDQATRPKLTFTPPFDPEPLDLLPLVDPPPHPARVTASAAAAMTANGFR